EAADVILRKGQGAPLLERGGAALLLRSVAGGQVPIRVAAFHPDASPQGVRELPAQLGYHETGTALDRGQTSAAVGRGEVLFRFQDQVNRIAVEWRCKRLRISGDRPAQAIREIVERLCSASIGPAGIEGRHEPVLRLGREQQGQQKGDGERREYHARAREALAERLLLRRLAALRRGVHVRQATAPPCREARAR